MHPTITHLRSVPLHSHARYKPKWLGTWTWQQKCWHHAIKSKQSPPLASGGGWPPCGRNRAERCCKEKIEEDSCDSKNIGEIMGYCRFLSLLLISALLSLSLSEGLGRRIGILRPVDKGGHSFEPEEESSGREMLEMEKDYKEPGANTNPRNGDPFNPPLRPPRP
ncbi:uncharacterized protein [Elaeis guineensis]|uniref:uncharacterized protein isoform X2 n=1 Tax=Elaeis guineensis var. tenera TaxID=51953 RepID=UPI003C6D0624